MRLDLQSSARLVLGCRGYETIGAHPLVEIAAPTEVVHKKLDWRRKKCQCLLVKHWERTRLKHHKRDAP